MIEIIRRDELAIARQAFLKRSRALIAQAQAAGVRWAPTLRKHWRDVAAVLGLFCFVIAGFLISAFAGFVALGVALVIVPLFDAVGAPLLVAYVERATSNDDDEN